MFNITTEHNFRIHWHWWHIKHPIALDEDAHGFTKIN